MNRRNTLFSKAIVQTDSGGSIQLGKAVAGKRYLVNVNTKGQILLDPVIPSPEGKFCLNTKQRTLILESDNIHVRRGQELHDM